MCVLAAKPGVAPATLAEAERLRRAAGYGPEGGTSVERIAPAAERLYGVRFTVMTSPGDPAFMAALKPGWCASILGKLSNFGWGHRLRRWDPDFTFYHQVFVQNTGDGYWWIDPLGKAPYRGERVTGAEIRTFLMGSAGLTKVATDTPEGIRLRLDLEEERTVTIPAGATAYDLSGRELRELGRKHTRKSIHRVALDGHLYWLVRLPRDGRTEVLMVRAGEVDAKRA
jgi:hypothetical protein